MTALEMTKAKLEDKRKQEDEGKLAPRPEEVTVVKCLKKDSAQTEEQNLLADWRSLSFSRGSNGKFCLFVSSLYVRRLESTSSTS